MEEGSLPEGTQQAVTTFRESIAQFSCKLEPPTSPVPVLRRSSRRPVPRRSYTELEDTTPKEPLEKKRLFRKLDHGLDQKKVFLRRSPASPPKKKLKRGLAPPETYAHLHLLPDYLQLHLDIVFCGINPGQKSAEIGHHFGHPTNHFWTGLHAGGLTSSKLPPTEDFTLPELYNIGLTNLVDRPTAEQSELSEAEMRTAVPAFLAKIARYRPRIVCFVGLSIAGTVQHCAVPRKHRTAKVMPGLMSFKLVYPKQEDTKNVDPISETLFFAMPSTSARVTQYQANEKVEIFADLKRCLCQVKTSSLDCSSMVAIDPKLFSVDKL
ncbi:uracil-DNA glycosylase-like protein [Desarmillaria tabescens]|uniref:Uracil-DNA glycosylase-like protein n=1 Tax=Armillaria tabescens TaxID=1929756 RepID=A0AA39T7F2_ARMTA|nr:uracil-DNA glycosylase-like protein [Desarmillaria tabescens]KAK0469691.1 uracil-DNA glycosylase-like protein [Desarmillaria tabescens]